MANCLTNNLWKFHQKILNYSENNEIFVGDVFWPHPVFSVRAYGTIVISEVLKIWARKPSQNTAVRLLVCSGFGRGVCC